MTKLLIAENDADMMDAYQLYFQDVYDVTGVRTTLEGMRQLDANADMKVALLDYNLNDGTVEPLLAYCKATNVRTILLSGKERDVKADANLVKPCDMRTLELTINLLMQQVKE